MKDEKFVQDWFAPVAHVAAEFLVDVSDIQAGLCIGRRHLCGTWIMDHRCSGT